MTSYLALYRGESIAGAKIVAVTAEPQLVRNFAAQMLGEPDEQLDHVLGELEKVFDLSQEFFGADGREGAS